jgi:hypothetical protein
VKHPAVVLGFQALDQFGVIDLAAKVLVVFVQVGTANLRRIGIGYFHRITIHMRTAHGVA